MTGRSRQVLAIAMALVAALIALGAGATKPPTESKEPWGDWETLELKARRMLFFSGRIEMRLGAEQDGRRTFDTTTRARFLGVDISRVRTHTVVDADTGRTLEYQSLSPKRGRHYVFGDTGYTVKKLRPSHGFDAPIDEWEVKSTRTYAYPLGADGKPVVVHDYYGMILQLADSGLREPGDEALFHVATSKGPRAYRVSVGEVREQDRSFTDLRRSEKRTTSLRECRLRIAPDDPEKAPEGFLNMEGETELWVESESRTVLEIKGKIPKVGRVAIALDSIG